MWDSYASSGKDCYQRPPVDDRNLANLVFWTTEAIASGIGCPLLPDIFVEVINRGTARKAKLTSSSPFQSSFT